jgi:alpha-tubulin suppressor-like RCC1 family protein
MRLVLLTLALAALSEACTPGDGCLPDSPCGQSRANPDAGNGQTSLDSGVDSSPPNDDGGGTTPTPCPCNDGRICEDGACVPVVAVAAGQATHVCALTAKGGVYCWGSNRDSIVPGKTDHVLRRPVAVEHGRQKIDAIQVYGSFNETGSWTDGASWRNTGVCVAASTEGVYCWGHDHIVSAVPPHGPMTPRRIGEGSLRDLSMNVEFGCGRDTLGNALCFGRWRPYVDGVYDSLHVLNSIPGAPSPLEQIAAGAHHALARTQAGALYGWGTNSYFQLEGSRDEKRTAGILHGLTSGVREVAAGAWHSCIRKDDGSVHCWGHNFSRAAGPEGDAGKELTSPTPVPGIVDASRIWAGPYETCARTAQGFRCWGVLGRGAGSNTPFLPPITDADELALGATVRCALYQGRVKCWGNNANGETGTDKLEAEVTTPTPIVSP